MPSREAVFLAELRAAARRGPRLVAHVVVMAVALLLVSAIAWAHLGEVDQVVVGEGRVIPTGQIKIVQNLEGGILGRILVREGDVVEEGQVLLRLENTTASASFGENEAKFLALEAAIHRLSAETSGAPLVFPAEFAARYPDLVQGERALYEARRAEHEASIEILDRQVEQKRQEASELESRTRQLETSLRLVSEEYQLTAPMVPSGAVSKVQLLRLERERNDLDGQLRTARLALPRVKSALAEAERRISEKREAFRAKALGELANARANRAALREQVDAARDRVERTEVRSPVRGTIKRLLVNTQGGVIRPGMDLIEIVPLEENLLIEAKIRPSDVAFLHPGQRANVKITAYDFSRYGSLPARLVQISADSLTDERGRETYYKIELRTDTSHLQSPDGPLPIIPGMVAQADIVTGRQTVLDYLVKPILRVRERALTER